MKNAIFMYLQSICPYTTSSYYAGQKMEFLFHRKSGRRKQEDIMITDKKKNPYKPKQNCSCKEKHFLKTEMGHLF